MRSCFVSMAICTSIAGCNADAIQDTNDPKDAAPPYEAVLKSELKGTQKGEGFFVFVDGKDPSPELLKSFQKEWPELQPGSKAPKGKANCVSLDELKFIDRNTAEVMGGTSNGMDGHGHRYRLTRKNGVWSVESVKTEFLS